MIKIPGSDFITIKPQGSAELKFGINISRTDNPVLPVKQRRITTFDFDQQIQMNLTGKIGDFMKIGFYILLPFLLIAKEPDLGTALVIGAAWTAMIVAWGVRWRLLSGLTVAAPGNRDLQPNNSTIQAHPP